MKLLEKELDQNWTTFFAGWTAQARKNWKELNHDKRFSASYRRLCAINAWKTSSAVRKLTPESVEFLHEAHNDVLVSHVAAGTGAWRLALQSLRSCIENVLCALYFTDHPVELKLWEIGQFRIGFSDLHTYFMKHPTLRGRSRDLCGLNTLKTEYSTLSKAVHASAREFRMTDKIPEVLLWSTEEKKIGIWSTRERKVVEALCLLLMTYFCEHLTGTKNTALRQMLFFALSSNKRELVKQQLHVSIPAP